MSAPITDFWKRPATIERKPKGKVIDPRGYVFIYVGKRHHLADVRGYAYEHRLVAEQVIGRRLEKGEEVHHKNENPSDNRPDNLVVAESHAAHFVLHRRRDKGRRLPGEANPMIKCECGCGAKLAKFDRFLRPRRFATGHNRKGRKGGWPGKEGK